jgi:hypothetical protein
MVAAPPSPVDQILKYLTSITEGIGGWLRYQDGKATALSAILGVGLVEAIGLTDTDAFKESTAPGHDAVVSLFWISLVAVGVAILLFALEVIPNFPKPGRRNGPKSLY